MSKDVRWGLALMLLVVLAVGCRQSESSGGDDVEVPTLGGLRIEVAAARIAAAGLCLETITITSERAGLPSRVLLQSPVGGVRVSKLTGVALSVSPSGRAGYVVAGQNDACPLQQPSYVVASP